MARLKELNPQFWQVYRDRDKTVDHGGIPTDEYDLAFQCPTCGGHARRRAKSAGGRGTRDVWEGGHKVAASEAMGIDWMTLGELSEAIPPAYAEYVGKAALAFMADCSQNRLTA